MIHENRCWCPVASPPLLGLPSIQMVRRWCLVGPGAGEKTEKITINLGLVDLGQIDLLVQEGFYTNRTDFIRTAIRTQLASRGEALDQTAARRTLTPPPPRPGPPSGGEALDQTPARRTLPRGSCHYPRRDLEETRDTGQMI